MIFSLPGVLSLIRSEPFSQVAAQVVAGSAGFWQRSMGSQESCVHGSVSAQSSGVPGSHVPRPSQVSSTVQRLESSQALPGASYWQVDEQQSPSSVLPSSHCSETATT